MPHTCRAVTNAGERCSKPRAWPSQYCWFHQDRKQLLVFLAGAVVAALLAWGVAVWQNRVPKLSAVCRFQPGDFLSLICTVNNSGRAAAQEVRLLLQNPTPAGLTLRDRDLHVGVTLGQGEAPSAASPPGNPRGEGSLVHFVDVGPIGPKSKVSFRLTIEDEHGERSARQATRIWAAAREIASRFNELLTGEGRDPVDVDGIGVFAAVRMLFIRPAALSFAGNLSEVKLEPQPLPAVGEQWDRYESEYGEELLSIVRETGPFIRPVLVYQTRSGFESIGAAALSFPIQCIPMAGGLGPAIPKSYELKRRCAKFPVSPAYFVQVDPVAALPGHPGRLPALGTP